MANPEAAVRAHWKALPNSKPTGLSETDAMAQALRMLSVRMPNVAPDAGTPFGEITVKMMDNYQDFLIDSGMTKRRFDSASLLAPEIWKKANEFDREAVTRAAKDYK
jgi:NitT/TauT family transport system substrate-binding protein